MSLLVPEAQRSDHIQKNGGCDEMGNKSAHNILQIEKSESIWQRCLDDVDEWSKASMFKNTLLFVIFLFVFPAAIGCLFFFLWEDAVIISIAFITSLHINYSIYDSGRWFTIMTLLSGIATAVITLTTKHLQVDFYRLMMFPISVCLFGCSLPIYHFLYQKGSLVVTGASAFRETPITTTIYMFVSIFVVFGQLYTTVLLAPKVQTLLEIVIFCSAYPFFILCFKVAARTMANKCSPILAERVEFHSIIFAALPFRVLFLNMAGDWLTLLLVMGILLAFKSIKYSIRFHPKTRSCVGFLVTMLSSRRSSTPSSPLEVSAETPEPSITPDRAVLSGFYFHVLYDLGSTPLTIILFLVTRKFRGAFEIEAATDLSTRRFTQLLFELLTSFVVDCIFLGAVLIIAPSAITNALQQGYLSVRSNLLRYCVHSIFLVVTVVYLLSVPE